MLDALSHISFQAFRRAVATLFSLFLLAAAARLIVALFVVRFSVAGLVLSLLALILALGLFQNRPAARRLAAMLCLLASFAVLSVFSPFAAADAFAAGKQPLDVVESLMWLIPLELSLLASVVILDPRKSERSGILANQTDV